MQDIEQGRDEGALRRVEPLSARPLDIEPPAAVALDIELGDARAARKPPAAREHFGPRR